MSDLGTFLNNLIEKFDIKKLTICAFIVLALMVIPNINFLDFLMPLDDAEKSDTPPTYIMKNIKEVYDNIK